MGIFFVLLIIGILGLWVVLMAIAAWGFQQDNKARTLLLSSTPPKTHADSGADYPLSDIITFLLAHREFVTPSGYLVQGSKEDGYRIHDWDGTEIFRLRGEEAENLYARMSGCETLNELDDIFDSMFGRGD